MENTNLSKVEKLIERKNYQNWNTDDAILWLEEALRLPQYKQNFMELALDGSMIDYITDQDLEQDLHIHVRLHRVKIIEGIKKLKNVNVNPNITSPPQIEQPAQNQRQTALTQNQQVPQQNQYQQQQTQQQNPQQQNQIQNQSQNNFGRINQYGGNQMQNQIGQNNFPTGQNQNMGQRQNQQEQIPDQNVQNPFLNNLNQNMNNQSQNNFRSNSNQIPNNRGNQFGSQRAQFNNNQVISNNQNFQNSMIPINRMQGVSGDMQNQGQFMQQINNQDEMRNQQQRQQSNQLQQQMPQIGQHQNVQSSISMERSSLEEPNQNQVQDQISRNIGLNEQPVPNQQWQVISTQQPQNPPGQSSLIPKPPAPSSDQQNQNRIETPPPNRPERSQIQEVTKQVIPPPSSQVNILEQAILADSQNSSLNQANLNMDILVLKAVEGQLLNNVYIIGQNGAALGRHSASNDIVISESFVSRRHCEIKYVDSVLDTDQQITNHQESSVVDHQTTKFYLRDIGSTTGAFIMVRQEILLRENMMFQMGLSEFRIVTTSKKNIIELHVFEGPQRNRMITVDAMGLSIGRDMNNTFYVQEDSQMSNFHAKISYHSGSDDKAQGFYLQDVGSTNRTWLRLSSEGEVSNLHPLKINDIIKIGSTVFVVQSNDIAALKNMPVINRKNIQNQGCIQGRQAGNGLIAQFQYHEEEKSNVFPQPANGQQIQGAGNQASNIRNWNQNNMNYINQNQVQGSGGSGQQNLLGAGFVNQMPPENISNSTEPNTGLQEPAIAGQNFQNQNQGAQNQYYGNFNGGQGSSIPDSSQNRHVNIHQQQVSFGEQNMNQPMSSDQPDQPNQVMFSGSPNAQMNAPSSTSGQGESCKICYGAECDAAFIPCGHNFACVSCAQRCECCPVCRMPFEDIIKIYKQ